MALRVASQAEFVIHTAEEIRVTGTVRLIDNAVTWTLMDHRRTIPVKCEPRESGKDGCEICARGFSLDYAGRLRAEMDRSVDA